jgi:hypothetical protein
MSTIVQRQEELLTSVRTIARDVDTPYSVGRHVRDTMSAPLMIAKEV